MPEGKVGKCMVGEPDSIRTMLLRLPVGSKIIKEEDVWKVYTKFFTYENKTLEKALEGVLRHVRS